MTTMIKTYTPMAISEATVPRQGHSGEACARRQVLQAGQAKDESRFGVNRIDLRHLLGEIVPHEVEVRACYELALNAVELPISEWTFAVWIGGFAHKAQKNWRFLRRFWPFRTGSEQALKLGISRPSFIAGNSS